MLQQLRIGDRVQMVVVENVAPLTSTFYVQTVELAKPQRAVLRQMGVAQLREMVLLDQEGLVRVSALPGGWDDQEAEALREQVFMLTQTRGNGWMLRRPPQPRDTAVASWRNAKGEPVTFTPETRPADALALAADERIKRVPIGSMWRHIGKGLGPYEILCYVRVKRTDEPGVQYRSRAGDRFVHEIDDFLRLFEPVFLR